MQIPHELKLKYLDRRVKDIERLRSSLAEDDYEFAKKLGHQLKGNAVTFEFPQMAFIGSEMETAANQKDKERVKKLVEKMENLISFFQPNFIN
jgi:HPt (histidine-containing phosphotransfer) domain-containing protein